MGRRDFHLDTYLYVFRGMKKQSHLPSGKREREMKSATATRVLSLALLLTLPGAMADSDYPRPRHDPDLDKRWMAAHGKIAPYTCRPVASAAEVDIEHIVAFAEARRSGLPQSRAKEFVDDPLNIAVAYPAVNRYQKRDLDIAQWQPAHNRCWYARQYERV